MFVSNVKTVTATEGKRRGLLVYIIITYVLCKD